MADLTAARSRRSILAGAAAATVGAVAGSLAQAAPAAAVDGDIVHVGESLSATAETRITLTGAIPAHAAIRGDHATGIGVYGSSDAQPGVYGQSQTSTAVVGMSFNGHGVDGITHATDPRPGVAGRASGAAGTGVLGISGDVPLDGLVAPGTGVLGYADSGTTARGVHGKTTVGEGVRGEATTGTAGRFVAGAHGTALAVTGKATFSRSGKVPIKAGKSSYRKSLAGVTTSSLVFAVLRTYRGGIYVAAVIPGTDAFTIRLNKALGSDTYCSWIVIN